jgi:ATP-binding cassette, sub-family E, member 1
MNRGKHADGSVGENTRIAIINAEKCKPKKCGLECKRQCPLNKTGKACVAAEKDMKTAEISEILCVGCGICVKKCPFEAIKIINLPAGIPNQTVHRFGPNQFKLFRLPQPKLGGVLGLVGTNGIGKSTALKILCAKLTPNLGQFSEPPSWPDIIKYYRGSELQGYFTKVIEEEFKCALKPQYVDLLPRFIKGIAGDIINKKDKKNMKDTLIEQFEMSSFLAKNIDVLSGGELQRFAIALCIM